MTSFLSHQIVTPDLFISTSHHGTGWNLDTHIVGTVDKHHIVASCAVEEQVVHAAAAVVVVVEMIVLVVRFVDHQKHHQMQFELLVVIDPKYVEMIVDFVVEEDKNNQDIYY